MLKKYEIPQRVLEPERHNQNLAEGVIKELCKKWYRTIFKLNYSRDLWSYELPHFIAIMSRTTSYSGDLNEMTSLKYATGETVNITEYLNFEF